jgi:hypothetical protein
MLVSVLANPGYVRLYADDALEVALERFDARVGIIPVFSRSDGRRVEGVITVETILQFLHRSRK